MNARDRQRARSERCARETAALDRVLGRIGPWGCPWCEPALFADWDYDHDQPFTDVVHDRRCLGPSSGWHKRVASDWLIAQLKLRGYRVGDYDLDGGVGRLTRHRTLRMPA